MRWNCSSLFSSIRFPPSPSLLPPSTLYHQPFSSPLATAFCKHRALVLLLRDAIYQLQVASTWEENAEKFRRQMPSRDFRSRLHLFAMLPLKPSLKPRRETFTPCHVRARVTGVSLTQRMHENVRVPTFNMISDALQYSYPVNIYYQYNPCIVYIFFNAEKNRLSTIGKFLI